MMIKVIEGQDPYNVIGKYIQDHITVIEDIIAVIKINEVETNQLFMVDGDINKGNYFIWENDWWEGEKDITLIDFFPVSEAQHANQSVQSADTISRQAAIAVADFSDYVGLSVEDVKKVTDEVVKGLKRLPSAEPEIIRCEDCKYWERQIYQGVPLSWGYCESECAWNSLSEYVWGSLYGKTYEVEHIETDEDHFCGYAKRRSNDK